MMAEMLGKGSVNWKSIVHIKVVAACQLTCVLQSGRRAVMGREMDAADGCESTAADRTSATTQPIEGRGKKRFHNDDDDDRE